MKTFYFIERQHHNRRRNNREITIYQAIDNSMVYTGNLFYSTGSTLGAKSEVFSWLIANGEVENIENGVVVPVLSNHTNYYINPEYSGCIIRELAY